MKTINVKACIKQAVMLLLVAALCLTSVISTQAETKISNPRIKQDENMKSGQKVTYDCVYFGSYPQAEVIGSKSAATTIDKTIRNGQDYIVDAALYAKLKKSKKWDKNGDVVIGGNKYRRIKAKNATKAHLAKSDYDAHYYNWNDSYHYFKYQPIKWRVLYTTKKEMMLLADQALDCQKYNTVWTDVTWAKSTVRSWLNGYGSNGNKQGISYKKNGFADIAFTKKQYNTILKSKVKNSNNLYYDTPSGADTNDKIFLLAEKQVYSNSAKQYGFASKYDVMDEARRSKSSSYAKAMGCWSIVDTESIYNGNCYWWLRSSGSDTRCATDVKCYGQAYYSDNVGDLEIGVRPALIIDLKKTAQYKYAGTVCTDGTVQKKK